jgi:uncharacterized protein
MERGIFSLDALDRANHVELLQQIMFSSIALLPAVGRELGVSWGRSRSCRSQNPTAQKLVTEIRTTASVFFYSLCRTMWLMKRDEIIGKLKAREADLRAQGVAHAALFGSVARGDDRPDSDIDILVDLDPAVVVTIFDYAGVKDFIADMFDHPVDVVSRESLKQRVRPRAIADAIYAF